MSIKPVIKESFMLRRIIPKNLALEYFKGKFLNRQLPKNKIKTSTNFVKMGKEIGRNSDYEVYRFIDKTNNPQTILTTNHTSYAQKPAVNTLIRCRYCMRNNMKNPVGIPVSMEITDSKVIFACVDPCCDFGCTFSYLKRLNLQTRFYKGPLYSNAEQLLLCLYYRIHPDRKGEHIKEKPDFDLLKSNGGPLTDEEFDKGSAKYISIPNITILPAKKQFIKLNKN